MCAERQRLEQEIITIKSELQELPQEKLICARDRNYIKWYHSDGQHITYISKKKRKLAEQLAVKKYLSYRLEELLQEQQAIDFYLRHHNVNESRAMQLLDVDSPYYELLAPNFVPFSQELHHWMTQSYESNKAYPEQCIHKTTAGILVRSKSEALITTLLYINKIPFRYECALTLGDTIVYPDFTIRHPQNGQTFYLEHFGMMDNPNYCRNAFSKLQLYAAHGIFPSIQLLTTFETKEHPLDSNVVENLIQQYFF